MQLYERTPCEHPEATGPHTTDGTHRRWLVNPPDAVCGGPSYEPVDILDAATQLPEAVVVDRVTAYVADLVPTDLPPGRYLIVPV